MKARIILFLLLSFFSAQTVLAAKVVIKDGMTTIPLGEKLEYFEDVSAEKSISEMLNQPNIWLRSQQETPNFGFTKSAYWFRVDISDLQSRKQAWLLEIAYALLDDIQVVQVADEEVVSVIQTGDMLPFAQRPISHRNFVFPLELTDHDHLTLYIRLQSEDTIQLPIAIWNEQELVKVDQRRLIGQGAYFGIMLVMILYNLFIFISVRDKTYLMYVLYVFSFAMFQAVQNGFTYQFLWPEDVLWNHHSVLFFAACLIAVSSMFIYSFLNLKENERWYGKVLKIVALVGCVYMTVCWFLPYYTVIKIIAITGFFVITCGFVAGVHLWTLGSIAARYFTIAFGFLLVGMTLFISNKLGLVPRNMFTENSAQLGAVVEVVMLSLALADRINRERKERYVAQERVLEEVRGREKVEKDLISKSFFDELTGCPNKALLQRNFENIRDNNPDVVLHIVLIYLNRFQEINNTLGHQNGDELLRRVSLRLVNTLKEHSCVVELSIDNREGGNQVALVEGVTFALLIQANDLEHVDRVVKSITHSLNFPFEYHGMPLDVNGSVGISCYPQHGDDFISLLRHARVAVEAAQDRDLGMVYYSTDMDPYSARRLVLVGELKRAVQTNELEMYVQPQLDLGVNKISGVEALIRWEHPTHGFIAPDEFIPLAEQTGLIKSVNYWVLDTSISHCAYLLGRGMDITMSINLSAKNLQELDLVQTIAALVEKYCVPASCLVFEITETAMMVDPKQALKTLTELNELCCQIAIDDFGTGYSSLAYIKQLPIDEIKIDRSFVLEMTQGSDDAVIVNTTLNMSHNLGLRVVAEGVENEEALRILSIMGCDVVQGYFLTKPIPLHLFEDWLKRSSYPIKSFPTGKENADSL